MMEEELDELYSDVFQIPGGVSFKSHVTPKKKKNLSNRARTSQAFDECSVDIYSDLSMDSTLHTENNCKTSPLKLKPICNLNKPLGNGGLEKNKVCLDLYTDLITSELTEKEKTKQHVKELEKVNQELLEENKILKQLKEQLSKNISSLFLTAKREIKKKEEEITKLKKIIDEQKVTAKQRDTILNTTSTVNAENDRKYVCTKRSKTSSLQDNNPAVTREVIISARHEGHARRASVHSTDHSDHDSDKVKAPTFPVKDSKTVDSDHSSTDLRLKLRNRQHEIPANVPQDRLKEDETSRKTVVQHCSLKGDDPKVVRTPASDNLVGRDDPKAVRTPASDNLVGRPSVKQNIQGNTTTKETLSNSKKVSGSTSPCSKKRRVSAPNKPHSEIRDRLQQEINQSYSLAACKGVAARKLKDSTTNDVSKDVSAHHFASSAGLKSKDRHQNLSSDKQNLEMGKTKDSIGLNLKCPMSSLEVSNFKASNVDKTNDKKCEVPRQQVHLKKGSELAASLNNSLCNREMTQAHAGHSVDNALRNLSKYSEPNLLSVNKEMSTPSKKFCNMTTTRKKEIVCADVESNSVTQPFSHMTTIRKKEIVCADLESNSVTQPFSLLKEDSPNSGQGLTSSSNQVTSRDARDSVQAKNMRAFPIVTQATPSLSSSFVDIESFSDEHDEVETNRNDNKSDYIESRHGLDNKSDYIEPRHGLDNKSDYIEPRHGLDNKSDYIEPRHGLDNKSDYIEPRHGLDNKSDYIEPRHGLDNKSDYIEPRHGLGVNCKHFPLNNTSTLLPKEHTANLDTDFVSTHDEDSDDPQTRLDPRTLFEQKPSSSDNKFKVIVKSDNSNDSDKTSNGSSVVSLDTDKQSSNDEGTGSHLYTVPKVECSLASSPTRYVTSITCTSNLILLGDEETTCTTFISPSKPHLLPSEFYPPGVRGQVSDKSCHVRHIRGQPEVIHKSNNDRPKNEKPSRVLHGEDVMVEETKACGKQLSVLTQVPCELNNDPNKITADIHGDHLKHNGELQCSQDSIHKITDPSKGNFDCVINLEKTSHDLERQSWMTAVQKTFQKVFKNELQSFKEGDVIYSKPVLKFNSNRNELFKKRLNALRKAKPASLPHKVISTEQPILTGQQEILKECELMASSPLNNRKLCCPDRPNFVKSANELRAANPLRDGESRIPCLDNVQTTPDTCLVTSSDHSLTSVRSNDSFPDENKMSHHEPDSTSDVQRGVKRKSEFSPTSKADIASDKSIPLKNEKASPQKETIDSRVNTGHDVTAVKSNLSLTDQLYLSDDDSEDENADTEDNSKFEEDIIPTKEPPRARKSFNHEIREDDQVLLREVDRKSLQTGGQSSARKCQSDIEIILNTTFGVSGNDETNRDGGVDAGESSFPKLKMESHSVLGADEISLMEVSLSEFDSDVAQARRGTPGKNTKSSQQNVYGSPLSFKNKIMPPQTVVMPKDPEMADKSKESLQVTGRSNKMSIDEVGNKLLSQKLKDLDQQTSHTSSKTTIRQNTLLQHNNPQHSSLDAHQQCPVLLSRLMTFEELKRNKLVKNVYVYTESETDERSDDDATLENGGAKEKLSSHDNEFIQKVRKVKKKLDLDFSMEGHSKSPKSLPFQSPILQVSDSMLSPPVKHVAGEDGVDLSKVKAEYQSSSNTSLNVSSDDRKLEKMPVVKELFAHRTKTLVNKQAPTGSQHTEAVVSSNTKQYSKGTRLCHKDVLKTKPADMEDGEISEENLVCFSKQNSFIDERGELEVGLKKEFKKPQKMNDKKSDLSHSSLSLDACHRSDRYFTINADRGSSDRGRKRSRSPSPQQHPSSRSVKHSRVSSPRASRVSSPRASRVSSKEDLYRGRQRYRDGKDVTNGERSKNWGKDRMGNNTDGINPEKKTSSSNISRDRSPQKHGQRSHSNQSRQVRERVAGGDTRRSVGQMKYSPSRSKERNGEKSMYNWNRKIFDRSVSPVEQDKKSSRPQTNYRGYQRRSPSNYSKEKTSPPKHRDENCSKSHYKNQWSRFFEEENIKSHSSKETCMKFRDFSPKREISENDLTSRGEQNISIRSQYGSPVRDNFEDGELSE